MCVQDFCALRTLVVTTHLRTIGVMAAAYTQLHCVTDSSIAANAPRQVSGHSYSIISIPKI